MPGSDNPSRRVTSSRSSHVPSSAIRSRRERRSRIQRSSAGGASISTPQSRRRPSGILRGSGPSGRLKASPRDGAGSVEATSTRAPEAAALTERAAAQVVLPTPPLPPMKWKRGLGELFDSFVSAFKGRFDAGDLEFAGIERGGATALLAVADLTQAREDVRLENRELVLSHFAELHAHLRGQELFAQRRVVVEFRLDRRRDLVEDEPDTADQQRVDDD